MDFPEPWRQLGDLRGGVLTNTLQHIDQIIIRIDVVQTAGGDQALQDADLLGAEFRPAE